MGPRLLRGWRRYLQICEGMWQGSEQILAGTATVAATAPDAHRSHAETSRRLRVCVRTRRCAVSP